MPYQPVRHFMRHHIVQEGPPIFAIQHGVETQSTPAIVRLAGTLATQITPHLGTRSEERRVGKECRTEGPAGQYRKRRVENRTGSRERRTKRSGEQKTVVAA